MAREPYFNDTGVCCAGHGRDPNFSRSAGIVQPTDGYPSRCPHMTVEKMNRLLSPPCSDEHRHDATERGTPTQSQQLWRIDLVHGRATFRKLLMSVDATTGRRRIIDPLEAIRHHAASHTRQLLSRSHTLPALVKEIR